MSNRKLFKFNLMMIGDNIAKWTWYEIDTCGEQLYFILQFYVLKEKNWKVNRNQFFRVCHREWMVQIISSTFCFKTEITNVMSTCYEYRNWMQWFSKQRKLLSDVVKLFRKCPCYVFEKFPPKWCKSFLVIPVHFLILKRRKTFLFSWNFILWRVF